MATTHELNKQLLPKLTLTSANYMPVAQQAAQKSTPEHQETL